jgi:hypothetical protein
VTVAALVISMVALIVLGYTVYQCWRLYRATRVREDRAYREWVKSYNDAVRNGGSVGPFNGGRVTMPRVSSTGQGTPPPASRRS